MFASSSRLDLNITMGPQRPGHIKTILSTPLPIFIEYKCRNGDVTGSALWRMRAALKHPDRVREISFEGSDAGFQKLFKAANYHFPALESVVLSFSHGPKPDIPSTFLRGPGQLDLRLRRLSLDRAPISSVSGLLLSATALTDLILNVSSTTGTNSADGESSKQGSFLLGCLKGMKCLRSLDLTISSHDSRDSQPQRPAPNDFVPLSKLTRFHYSGPTTFLNGLMSGLSAPSLQDARLVLCQELPLLHISRVIDDVREEFRSVSVTFENGDFCFSSSTHSGKVYRVKPSFRFSVNYYSDSIKLINSTPSMKLSMAEELVLSFSRSSITSWVHVSSLREFIRQFRSVRVLRVVPFIPEIGKYLQQDDGEAILPALEQIELSISHLTGYSDEEYQRRAAADMAAFEPFVYAREQAGRSVNVFHREIPRSD